MEAANKVHNVPRGSLLVLIFICRLKVNLIGL